MTCTAQLKLRPSGKPRARKRAKMDFFRPPRRVKPCPCKHRILGFSAAVLPRCFTLQSTCLRGSIMYTNGNLEAHLSALLFLGCAALIFFLLVAAAILFFARRRWAPYPLIAIAAIVTGYGLLLAAFSYTSFDRTARRGDEKYFCEMDCHIAYSVQNVERAKSIGNVAAQGEFVIVTLRSHFDERTIAPW